MCLQFSSDDSVLLNMPFGALQTIVILLSSWAAVRFKHKVSHFGLNRSEALTD